MAFIYDIRNLKDCNDYKKKRKEFFDLLHLQQKLNKNYEEAMNYRSQIEDLGVQPPKAPVRTIEQEAQDVLLQQELAKKNLESIMKPEQAVGVITRLSDQQLYQMNSIFGKIKEVVKGRTNLTSTFFLKIFDRFVMSLSMNGDGAEPIPLPESILTRLDGDLLTRIMDAMKGVINPMTGQREQISSLVPEISRQTGLSTQEIRNEINMQRREENAPVDIPNQQSERPRRKLKGKYPLRQENPILPENVPPYEFIRHERRTADDALLTEATQKMGKIPRISTRTGRVFRPRGTETGAFDQELRRQIASQRLQLEQAERARAEVLAQAGGGGPNISFEQGVEDQNPTDTDTQTETYTQQLLRGVRPKRGISSITPQSIIRKSKPTEPFGKKKKPQI